MKLLQPSLTVILIEVKRILKKCKLLLSSLAVLSAESEREAFNKIVIDVLKCNFQQQTRVEVEQKLNGGIF
jgi:hypothetical protein